MTERAGWGEHALAMAQRQAAYLLQDDPHRKADNTVSLATQLIIDYVHHLHQPALAVTVALELHPVVERWSAWGPWAAALDALLALDEHAYGVADRIRLLHCRNHIACELGDFATAATSSETALHLAEAQNDQTLVALSLHERALAAYHYDDVLVAQTYWERAYATAQAHLPLVKLAHVSMNLGLIAEQQGRFESALHYFEQAQHQYETLQDIFFLAKVQQNIGNIQRKQGQIEQSIVTLQMVCNVFHALGALHEYGLAQNNIGYAYLEMAWYEEARAALVIALQTFDSIGGLNGKALALSNLAELYVTTQQWQQAATTIRAAHELAAACDKPLLIAAVDVDYGRMLAAQGNVEGAQQVWSSALAVQEAKGALHAAQHTRQLIQALADETV